MNKKLFECIVRKVKDVCSPLVYVVEPSFGLSAIKIYGCLDCGRYILTATVIESVISIDHVEFNSVSIDSDGRLYALFLVNFE